MNVIINSFNAGELTPQLRGRIDLDKYASGCAVLENFTVLPWGGAENRPGTEYLATCKHPAKAARLIPFEFNMEQAYMIEAGDYYFRFYANGAPVLSNGVPYEIATPYPASSIFKLRYVQSADVMFLAHPDFAPRRLARYGHTDFRLSAMTLKGGPFMDENDDDITVAASAVSGTVTLTASANIFTSDMVGNLMQIVHPREKNSISEQFTDASGGVPNRVGTYTLPVKGTWTLDTTGTWKGTLYLERSFDGGTTWCGYRSWTASADSNVDAEGFEDNENMVYRLRFANWIAPASGVLYQCNAVLNCEDYFIYGIVNITAVAGARSATATVQQQLGDTSAVKDWSFGAWNSRNGFPACIRFYQDRLCFANTKAQPQTIWLSTTGDYGNFIAGSEADNAMTYTIREAQVNAVNWLIPQRQLVVGTKAACGMLKPVDENEPLSPDNRTYDNESLYGTAAIDAVPISDVILYLERGSETLRELAYNFESDGYVSPNMTVLAEHVLRGGVAEIAYQQLPFPIIWHVRNDGQLVGFTYDRLQNVIAWHRHVTAGSFRAAAVLSREGADELWCIVERDGKRMVERFFPRAFDTVSDARFLDCALTYSGSATASVSELDHLEGRTVTALVDGELLPGLIVASGRVSFPNGRTGTNIVVGLPYVSKIQPMPLEISGANGSTVGEVKRISELAFKFYRTLGGKVGMDAADLRSLEFRQGDCAFDAVPDLLTGEIKLKISNGFQRELSPIIVQNEPLPMTLLSVIAKMGVFQHA